MNLANLFGRASRAFADLPAVALGEVTVWTQAQLAQRGAALAGAFLDRLGLRPGHRVGIAMKNHPDYVALLLACWHAGLAAVPINARLHPRELAFILDHAGARVCFVDDDLGNAIGPLAAEIETLDRVVSVEARDYAKLAQADPVPFADAAPEDLAWLFYTSGTTGRPKGAMLTHGNLLAMTASYLADVDGIAPGDAILHAAPMSHGSGLYILPHAARAAVQVVTRSGGFDPAEVIGLIGAHPGISMFGAPTMLRRLVEHPATAGADLANLKTVVYGGGPMYLADLDRAHNVVGFRLAQIYGQGESPMTITVLDKAHHADVGHPRHRQRLASVGTPQLCVEVRVADADDQPLPAGEVGEVLVRGASVMRGYWRNPDSTRAALRAGWLHTGDLGVMDADGFLTLRDRSRDLVISGGANIYPREVEEALLAHPDVAEASVVGRPHPEWGEEVVAFVVAAPGCTCDAAALDRHCLDRIARFKRPRAYRFVDALPKNNYGKVLKTTLRQWLEDEDS